MLNKPYNYEELEQKFPLQSQSVISQRISRIKEKLMSLGYEQIFDCKDGYIRFVRKTETGGINGYYSFNLWQIEHEPDDDFERVFRKIGNFKKR